MFLYATNCKSRAPSFWYMPSEFPVFNVYPIRGLYHTDPAHFTQQNSIAFALVDGIIIYFLLLSRVQNVPVPACSISMTLSSLFWPIARLGEGAESISATLKTISKLVNRRIVKPTPIVPVSEVCSSACVIVGIAFSVCVCSCYEV